MNARRRWRRASLAAGMDRVVRWAVALALLVLATGVVGALASEHLRQVVITREQPAAAANDLLMRDLLVAQSGLRAYVATGQTDFLTDKVPSHADIQADQDTVARLADRAQQDLVQRQEAAIDAWFAFRDHTVAVRRAGGDAALLLPRTPFGQVHAANQELAAALDGRVRRTTRLTSWVLGGTAALNAAEAGGLALLVWRHRRRLLDHVLVPLQGLRDTVVGDDPARRADATKGAMEVRELAGVVNRYLGQVAHTEQENAATVQRLESLDRQKTDFIATVSHELRTPLTSIAGYLEMLQDGDYGPLDAPQAKAITVAQRNTARLRCMIEELLILSRMEAGEVEMHVREVHWGQLAEVVVENLRPQADEGGVRLTLERRGLGTIAGDPDQLERALTNVIGNAVKFTPAGGAVTVRITEDAEHQVVEVADTGVGIPAEDLANVGRRFFRAGNVTDQSIPGTGLGLSIVTSIMASHGGSCQVDSQVGEGTTVRLVAPLGAPHPS